MRIRMALAAGALLLARLASAASRAAPARVSALEAPPAALNASLPLSLPALSPLSVAPLDVPAAPDAAPPENLAAAAALAAPQELAADVLSIHAPAALAAPSEERRPSGRQAARERVEQAGEGLKELAPGLDSLARGGGTDADAATMGARLSSLLTGDSSAPRPGSEPVPTQSRGARRSRLAGPLRLDPGLSPLMRADLEALQGALKGINLRGGRFFAGLLPSQRREMRAYFAWLKLQLGRRGELPAFHDTPNTTSGGVYSMGLALIYSYPDDAHGRFKRLLTIAHESYHQFADEKGIPVRENDRWPQERGAHLVELLFARHVRDNPELGIAFPRDTRLARPLELLDQGRVVPVLEEVDRRYDEYQRTGSLTAVEPDHYGGMLDRLTAELRASYTQLSALRRSGGGAQDETARQALERRLLALRRYWNANFSVFFGYLF